MNGKYKKVVLPYAWFVALCLSAPVLLADADYPRWEDDDHAYDRAHRAVMHGDILPIDELLARLKKIMPGDVLEVELERERGLWVYEFKVLDSRGRLHEVYLDATSGELLGKEYD